MPSSLKTGRRRRRRAAVPARTLGWLTIGMLVVAGGSCRHEVRQIGGYGFSSGVATAASTGAGGTTSGGGEAAISTAVSTGTGGSGGAAPPLCIGIKPGDEAWATEPGPLLGQGGAYSGAPTTIGSPPPPWLLKDFQPQSCGFEGVYGLDTFKGPVTVAALLAGW